MIKPSATIQETTIELVIGKPKGRAISTAICDRPCCSAEMTGRRSFCSELPWLATPLADVPGTTSDEPFTANVKPELKPANRAARNISRSSGWRTRLPVILFPLPAGSRRERIGGEGRRLVLTQGPATFAPIDATANLSFSLNISPNPGLVCHSELPDLADGRGGPTKLRPPIPPAPD